MDELEKEMIRIAGLWNGKNSGALEEKAQRALEVLEHLKEIHRLLEEIENI